eukprot:2816764-Pleurochrysis_carterae.AAC.1
MGGKGRERERGSEGERGMESMKKCPRSVQEVSSPTQAACMPLTSRAKAEGVVRGYAQARNGAEHASGAKQALAHAHAAPGAVASTRRETGAPVRFTSEVGEPAGRCARLCAFVCARIDDAYSQPRVHALACIDSAACVWP